MANHERENYGPVQVQTLSLFIDLDKNCLRQLINVLLLSNSSEECLQDRSQRIVCPQDAYQPPLARRCTYIESILLVALVTLQSVRGQD